MTQPSSHPVWRVPPTQGLQVVRRSLPELLFRIIASVETYPLERPELPAELPTLGAPRRIYECLRFYLRDVEYAISSEGDVRGLGRWVVRTATALSIILMGVGVVLLGLSAITGLIVVITGHFRTAMINILVGVLAAAGSVIIALLLVALVWVVVHYARRLRPRRAPEVGTGG